MRRSRLAAMALVAAAFVAALAGVAGGSAPAGASRRPGHLRGYGRPAAVRRHLSRHVAPHARRATLSDVATSDEEDYIEPGKGTVFPYRMCAAEENPWRAKLLYQENIHGEVVVHIELWAVPNATQPVHLTKLMLHTGTVENKEYFADTFVSGKLWSAATGTKPYGGPIIWNENRPVVRFTKLELDYDIGISEGGYRLVFTSLAGSMAEICPDNCTYATVTTESICTLGQLGSTPIIVVEGPDFVQPYGPPPVVAPVDDPPPVVAPAPGHQAGDGPGTAVPEVSAMEAAKAKAKALVEAGAKLGEIMDAVTRILYDAKAAGADFTMDDMRSIIAYINTLRA